jgi:hypothetical protein
LELIREVVETFVRLVKTEVDPGAALVSADDVFEVTKTPSVILQGPTLIENRDRRTPAMLTKRNNADLTFEQCRHPRLYHLDFDIVMTTGKEAELLDLTGKLARFYQLHPVLSVGEHGSLDVTELVPLGGLKRVNLSNLRQASGRCRIEDCPVYDGRISSGKLASGVRIEVMQTGETL